MTGRRGRRVVVYFHHPDFGRKAAAIHDLFRRRGLPVELRSGLGMRTRIRMATSTDLWIGYWNAVPLARLPRDYVFLNGEPLNVERWLEDEEWTSAMRGAREVWGYARTNEATVRELGVPFRFVPFGYAPFYEEEFARNTRSIDGREDIDVLFYGHPNERRARMLDQLVERGFAVRVVDRLRPAWGADLDRLIVRSKIVLGMHYYEEPVAQVADFARTDQLLSNRRFVVHEAPSAVADSDPDFVRYVTTCGYEEIPDTVAHFLAHPEERQARSAAAYEWFVAAYPIDAFIPWEQVRAWLGGTPGS